jgi:hypothetical protein
MPTRNNKITIARVSKMHVGNIRGVRLNMKTFFSNNMGHFKMLKVECISIMWEDTKGMKKYLRDIVSFKFENILYFIFF